MTFGVHADPVAANKKGRENRVIGTPMTEEGRFGLIKNCSDKCPLWEKGCPYISLSFSKEYNKKCALKTLPPKMKAYTLRALKGEEEAWGANIIQTFLDINNTVRAKNADIGLQIKLLEKQLQIHKQIFGEKIKIDANITGKMETTDLFDKLTAKFGSKKK